MIEKAAVDGIIIPLERLFINIENESEAVRSQVEQYKNGLFEKYGPNIPVDVVYRIIKETDPNGESLWNDNPGCFERHLRRREGNLLFPPARRLVTKKEIDAAGEKDQIDQERLLEKVNSYLENKKMEKNTVRLIEVQNLLEEAAAIGGDLGVAIQKKLRDLEETIIQLLKKADPDSSDVFDQAQWLSMMKRSPFTAQFSRRDSPILKEEKIPALLSEDLGIISIESMINRCSGADYRTNEADIRDCLEKAVKNGFSKERADQIISAWKKYDEDES